jgi:hypothetical protein
MATATKKAAKKSATRPVDTTGLGPRKLKWIADFDQVLAEFKRSKPSNPGFADLFDKCHALSRRAWVSSAFDIDPDGEFRATAFAVFFPEAAKVLRRIRKVLEPKNDAFRMPRVSIQEWALSASSTPDLNVYFDAFVPIKKINANTLASDVADLLRAEANKLLALAEKIEKTGRKAK